MQRRDCYWPSIKTQLVWRRDPFQRTRDDMRTGASHSCRNPPRRAASRRELRHRRPLHLSGQVPRRTRVPEQRFRPSRFLGKHGRRRAAQPNHVRFWPPGPFPQGTPYVPVSASAPYSGPPRARRGPGPRTATPHPSSPPRTHGLTCGPASHAPYQKSSTWFSVPYSLRRDFPMNFSLAMSRSNMVSSIQSSTTLTRLEKVGTLER